jgi:Peptidase U49
MTRIPQNESLVPCEYVEKLLRASAPERTADLKTLWDKYQPEFYVADDGAGVMLSASKKRVVFDQKTMSVYWLLSYAAWRVLDCYSPAVLCSLPPDGLAERLGLDPGQLPPTNPAGTTIETVVRDDNGLAASESRFDELIYAARTILNAKEFLHDAWPGGIPFPGAERESLPAQDRATFDLACMSTAFAFCHEIRHVMYAKDQNAPSSRPDEELACDCWAREFLTAKLGVYAREQEGNYEDILGKRSMATAVGIFVLYESSERHGDAGSEDYPPLADRMDATMRNTPLMPNHNFWVFYACVLLAILRRRRVTPNVTAQNAEELCALLVDKVRETS